MTFRFAILGVQDGDADEEIHRVLHLRFEPKWFVQPGRRAKLRSNPLALGPFSGFKPRFHLPDMRVR
jgi:hypothetical protein